MHRRVQPILILALTVALCLGALPPAPAPVTAPELALTQAPSLLASEAAVRPVAKTSGGGNSSLLAEFDMPFFSFAGITRPRL